MKKIFKFVLIVGASIAAVLTMLFASSKKSAAKKKFKEDVKDSKKAVKATKEKTEKVVAEKKGYQSKAKKSKS